MADNLSSQVIEALSAMAIAIVVAFFTIKKLVLNWKSTATETNIITLMHSELERMSTQNALLSTEVSRLHSEIIELNRQLRELTAENQRLHEQVVVLTLELTSFKNSIIQKGN